MISGVGVVTTTLRIRLSPVSAMKMLPALSTATPKGVFNRADRGGPLSPHLLSTTSGSLHGVPRVPATVRMYPTGMLTPATVMGAPLIFTTRMACMDASATYTFPALSTATDGGCPNVAEVAGTLSPHGAAVHACCGVPATVVMSPLVGLYWRITKLPVSAM